MAQIKLDQLTGDEKLPELIEMVAKLQKQVEWLMNGRIGGDNIKANSIQAEKIDVNELSAITANMGKLTSGEIYGAYIATRDGSYPRSEMSNTSDLFGAYATALNYIIMRAFSSSANSPELEFSNGSKRAIMYLASTFFNFQVAGDLGITAVNGTLHLDGNSVSVQQWSKIVNSTTGQTLQQALDAKMNV